MGFALASLFFLKFSRISSDKFFRYLCVAFGALAIERVVGVITYVIDPSDEGQSYARPWIYLIRLAAFALILIAIIQKNRSKI